MAQWALYRQIIRDNSVNRVTAVMRLLQCSGRPASVPNSHRRLLLSICWHVYKYKLRQRAECWCDFSCCQCLVCVGQGGAVWLEYIETERGRLFYFERNEKMWWWFGWSWFSTQDLKNRGRWFIFSWERWEYVEKYINTHSHTHFHVIADGFIQINLQRKNITKQFIVHSLV